MRTLVVPFLAAALSAQVPTDAVLVLEATNAYYVPNWRIVDSAGHGYTILHNQTMWSLPSPVSVAVDPVDARLFYFQANPAGFPAAGTWRQDVDLVAIAQQALVGYWQLGVATSIACGPNHVFALQGGTVTASNRVAGGGGTTTLFAVANAVDLATAGTRVFVATNANGAPSPVLSYDLTNSVLSPVGAYAGVRSIAASPVLPELALGFDNGLVARIDIATGAIVNIVAGASLPVIAVDYTTSGVLVWADATQVHSELSPVPIYTALQAVVDLSVAKVPTASAVPFGAGCGINGGTQWFCGSPTLGNSTFQIGFVIYPSAPLALLALGTSRATSSILGAPLPVDLAPVGAPGCQLLVDPEVVLSFASWSSVTLPLPIPNNPALAGQAFHAQGFVRQVGNALGLDATSGITCVMR